MHKDLNSFLVTTATLFLLSLNQIVNAQQTPYYGTPSQIPGKIEAEDFDKGGEGVAYHDIDESNIGGQYRPDEGVDIENCSEGGYNLGWIYEGEWIEYTVYVQTAGNYTIELQLASLNEGSRFHIEFDGNDVTGTKYYESTGDWQNWLTVQLKDVSLNAGEQVMRFAVDGSLFNLNYINAILQKDLIFPQVEITSPQDKDDFFSGDDITITAVASDSDGSIIKVEFYADDDRIGIDASTPYSMIWASVPAGKWDLTAVATDNDGAQTTSEKVDITVHYPNFENDLVFSKERGFYDENFDLSISCDIDGATIKYTLNGDDPLNSSTAYNKTSPVTISINPASTTGRGKTPGVVVRAVAVKSGEQQTKIETHSYIFIDKVKTQSHPGGDWPDPGVNGQQWHYHMNSDVVNDSRYKDLIDDALLDIPTISMVTDLDNLLGSENGIYVNAEYHGIEWERIGSIELINPDGTEGFQINAGIRIRGGWSRHDNYPKHAFRLFFREKYGKNTLKYPLFGDEGTDEFKKMDLRTSQNYAWSNGYVSENTMNRDVWSRDVQREMGQPYTRSRYYHLYINGCYWGLFQTQERPEANFAESYFGGNDNEYDVVKIDIGEHFNIYEIEATDGNLDGWREVWEACNKGFSLNEDYFNLEGRNSNGQKDPSIKKLVDIDNLIDYMLIIFYAGNFDAPVSKFRSNKDPNNFYAIYNREQNDGFIFFAHDCEHTLLMHNIGPGEGILENRVNIGNIDSRSRMEVHNFEKFHPQWVHHKLTENEEYRMRFADHVYKHFYNNGVLTEERATELFLQRAKEIELAIIAESARWGDMSRSKHAAWQPTIDEIVDEYFPQRGELVLEQLFNEGLYPEIEPPVFKLDGTEIIENTLQITDGFQLVLTNPNSSKGSIKYTLDGTDPREIGGAVASNALDAGDEKTISINSTSKLKARIFYNNIWSALHEITLTANENLSLLKITEIHYHPLDEGEISGREFEFVELKNTSTSSMNLSLASFIKGISYTFPSGTIIKSGEFIVLASNSEQFNNRYKFEPFDEFDGQLDNGGEKLVLVEADGDTIVSIRYNDKAPWPTEPDNLGYSLVSKDVNATGDQSDPANWRTSHSVHGSPGQDDIDTVVEDNSISAPQKYELMQNYPNPFNPTTKIQFVLKNDTKTTLKIFDITGRTVETLVDEKLSAGFYSYLWKAINNAAGVYFYQLQTSDGFNSTRKMVLIK